MHLTLNKQLTQFFNEILSRSRNTDAQKNLSNCFEAKLVYVGDRL